MDNYVIDISGKNSKTSGFFQSLISPKVADEVFSIICSNRFYLFNY